MSENTSELSEEKQVANPKVVSYPGMINLTSAAGRPIRLGMIQIDLNNTPINTKLMTVELPCVGPSYRHAVNDLVWAFAQSTFWRGTFGIMLRRICSATEEHQPLYGRLRVVTWSILSYERDRKPVDQGVEMEVDLSLVDSKVFEIQLMDFLPKRLVPRLVIGNIYPMTAGERAASGLGRERHMITSSRMEIYTNTDFRATSTNMLGPNIVRYEVYVVPMDLELEGQRSGYVGYIDFPGWPCSVEYAYQKQYRVAEYYHPDD